MSSLTPNQLKLHHRLQTDLPFFCLKALRIKLKTGGEGPFLLNKAQQYLHDRIEAQKAKIGKVRVLVLKGRQQGISTYIAARFYHNSTRNRGRNVFILSHHAVTTETLFQIVDKYHVKCPQEITPKCVVSNNRRMKFDNESQYTVGTAGTGAIGRGDTNHYLHWSEVAFCENIPELLTGIVQTVGDVDGTEKIYESTANGVGNFFHKACMDALEGKGEFELVFIPWYWQDEYRAVVPEGFSPTEEEDDLKTQFGLDDGQLQWRRNKISEFEMAGQGKSKFQQEYPNTVHEAFVFSGDALIPAEAITKARKAQLEDPNAPLVVSVDPARNGDRTVITWRRGRRVEKIKILHQMNEMILSGKLANIITKDVPQKVFVDITGACGNGAVDRLHELGYAREVTGIQFSSKPDDDRYLNKRAEMAGLLLEWFLDEGGCRIPDDEEINVELGMIPAFKETSSGRLQLESKEKIIKEYGKSPDIFDSIMLSFAQRVRGLQSGEHGFKRKNVQTAFLTANRQRLDRQPLPVEGDGIKRSSPFKAQRIH